MVGRRRLQSEDSVIGDLFHVKHVEVVNRPGIRPSGAGFGGLIPRVGDSTLVNTGSGYSAPDSPSGHPSLRFVPRETSTTQFWAGAGAGVL